MRGKHDNSEEHYCDCRITPADAGKTGGEKNTVNTGKDHPRGCGENLIIRLYTCTPVGSPPRRRGKLPIFASDIADYRITPADAGKTIATAIEPH